MRNEHPNGRAAPFSVAALCLRFHVIRCVADWLWFACLFAWSVRGGVRWCAVVCGGVRWCAVQVAKSVTQLAYRFGSSSTSSIELPVLKKIDAFLADMPSKWQDCIPLALKAFHRHFVLNIRDLLKAHPLDEQVGWLVGRLVGWLVGPHAAERSWLVGWFGWPTRCLLYTSPSPRDRG